MFDARQVNNASALDKLTCSCQGDHRLKRFHSLHCSTQGSPAQVKLVKSDRLVTGMTLLLLPEFDRYFRQYMSTSWALDFHTLQYDHSPESTSSLKPTAAGPVSSISAFLTSLTTNSAQLHTLTHHHSPADEWPLPSITMTQI